MEFQVKGKIHVFDAWHILLEVVATIVLLNACSSITNIVAFYIIPNGVSTTLRTKRNEWVNRRGVFAEMGIKAAVAVNSFNQIDKGKDGRLIFKDLVQVFGAAPDVSYEKASQIAKCVLADAAKDPEQGLSFTEFLNCVEHGNVRRPRIEHGTSSSTHTLRASAA